MEASLKDKEKERAKAQETSLNLKRANKASEKRHGVEPYLWSDTPASAAPEKNKETPQWPEHKAADQDQKRAKVEQEPPRGFSVLKELE